MNYTKILGHVFTIAIFTALSYLLTHSIAIGNILGIVFSIISLGATIIFLRLLPKLNQPDGNAEE